MIPAAAVLILALATGQTPAGRAKDAYARALDLDAKGNFSGALSLLWEAAGLAPDDPDIQNRLGEALDRVGALDAAIDAYDKALTRRPSFARAANNLVLALVRAGRGPEATMRAEAHLARAPDDLDRLFTLGLAQSEQDVDAAIKTFRRILDRDPRHALARYNLALVLKRMDRLGDAIEELGRALRIEPRAEAHYTLGVIYWQQGDLGRAATSLRAAVAADPRYADAHYTLGAVLKTGRDWTGASASLRRAIALRPDLASAHYTLSQVLQLSGDEVGAQKQRAEAESIRERGELEQKASMWTSVGTQKLDAGDPTGALDWFRRATSVLEPYAPAHYQMGRALQRLGQTEAARTAFARAHELNPSLVPPRN